MLLLVVNSGPDLMREKGGEAIAEAPAGAGNYTAIMINPYPADYDNCRF